ncbi:MAG: hypothetical protein PSV46_19175 [Reyranella sp.]|nr:hypothetical protein [Reyranella sp.]
MPTPDTNSLGGAWNGLYFYPGYGEPVTFVAILIDAGTRFSGSVHEYEGIISEKRILLYATLQGQRDGTAVSFIKTYDGTGGWEHSVRYEGALNDAATEIEGRWYVDGVVGTFLMTRAGAMEEAELRKVLEPVRAS